MSKLDQIRALAEAKRTRLNSGGLRLKLSPNKSKELVGDGVALTSMAHPPGLIDKMADAIKAGKLDLKRGRPLAKDADKTLKAIKPWEAEGVSRRTWYRRRAEKSK